MVVIYDYAHVRVQKDKMTRSYGGEPERKKDKPPDVSSGGDRPQWERKLDSLSRYSDEDDGAIKPVKIDFGRRVVAAMIDLAAAYGVSMVVAIIPFVNEIVSVFLTIIVVYIFRDWFYSGRGIGKNFMGLQVVDVMYGTPCSLMQAFKRNIIIFAAPLLLYIFLAVVNVLRLLHVPHLEPIVGPAISILNTVGFIFIALAIPYEAYRAYDRPDGRRFGDQFAGTTIIDAPMDFSSIFPKES